MDEKKRTKGELRKGQSLARQPRIREELDDATEETFNPSLIEMYMRIMRKYVRWIVVAGICILHAITMLSSPSLVHLDRAHMNSAELVVNRDNASGTSSILHNLERLDESRPLVLS